MRLESENFIVRDIAIADKKHVYELEMSRPWVRPLIAFKDKLTAIANENMEDDLFVDLWNAYLHSGVFWVIERKTGEFIGSATIDQEGSGQACFYIQVMDDANLDGLGEEMLNPLLSKINDLFSIEEFEIELWNDSDRTRQIYEEAGYKMINNCLEIAI